MGKVKKNMKQESIQKIQNIIRTLLIAVSVCIFIYISYDLAVNFFSRKVIVTENWDYENNITEFKPPLIAICAQDPFAHQVRPMYSIEEFMQHSINVTKSVLRNVSINMESFLVSQEELSQYCLISTIFLRQGKTSDFELEDLITANGHCTVVRITRLVLATEDLFLILNKDVPSSVYILSEEEVLYMHYLPFKMNHKKINLLPKIWMTSVELFVEKSIDNVGQNCIYNHDYNRKECMVAEISESALSKICDLPWDIQQKTNETQRKCSLKTYFQKALGMSHFINSFKEFTGHGYRRCPGKTNFQSINLLRSKDF